MLETDYKMQLAHAEAQIREAKRQRKNNFLFTARAVGIETLTHGELKVEALKVYHDGVYGYIPKNLMDDYEFRSLQSFVRGEYTFFVDEVFEENGELIFLANRKDAMAYQAKNFWKYAKVGQRYNAFVSGVDRFNVWLLIEGVRVQMSREEYSYKYQKDMQLEVFIGDELEVQIVEINVEEQTVQVSRKVLEADPRMYLKDYKKGSTYACTIENVDFELGIFVTLEPKGIVAKSGFPPSKNGRLLAAGDKVNFKVTWIDERKGLVGGIIIDPRDGQLNKAFGRRNGR